MPKDTICCGEIIDKTTIYGIIGKKVMRYNDCYYIGDEKSERKRVELCAF